MRILSGIDVPFVPFGGSTIVCNDWYSRLPPDIQVRFLTLAPNRGDVGKWWSMTDVELLEIEKKRGVEEFPGYVRELRLQIEKHISSFAPDVIHCQHLNFGFSRAVADIEDCPAPRLGICHGTDVQLASRSDFFMKNLQHIAARMDRLLFPTQNMLSDFLKYGGRHSDMVVVPHGIPDDAYRRGPPRRDDGSIRIVYAGRLTPFKGVMIVLSAMRLLPDRFHLTIIGDEDEPGYLAKLLEIVTAHRLQHRTTLVGQMPRRQLWDELTKFALMVFPSTELECFALTTIEAQAQGLPIAYHRYGGGIANVVGDSGAEVSENTPEAWARVLRNLGTDPHALAKYQELGRANAERFRMSQVRECFFNVSRELLTSRHQQNAGIPAANEVSIKLTRHFDAVWAEGKALWATRRVPAVAMRDGATVPVDYCLSTIARVVKQHHAPTDPILEVIERLHRVSDGQFFYPVESLHISLLGCAPRLATTAPFTPERIAKIGEICATTLTGVCPIRMTLRGLSITGAQVFVQVIPHGPEWAHLRQSLEDPLRRAGEEPLSRPDKLPIHMNVMRLCNNDPAQIQRILNEVRRVHDLFIGELRVSTIEYLTTDFVVSSANTRIHRTFHLADSRAHS